MKLQKVNETKNKVKKNKEEKKKATYKMVSFFDLKPSGNNLHYKIMNKQRVLLFLCIISSISRMSFRTVCVKVRILC